MDRSLNGSSSCVKLFLCSNPEDSVVERRALREGVFPRLREDCRYTLGLDVSVVDPFESSDPSRWPDENTRQQLITECRESSAGPFLLALIGRQYGTASLPAQVEVSEFQLLLQEGQQAGVCTQELERAYQRDENSVPPSYRLRPLHGHTRCPQSENTQDAKIQMKAKEEELRKVFQTSVRLCVHNGRMTPERAHSYRRSGLDADLRFALDTNHDHNISKRCLVYIHKVINATGEREKQQMNSQLLSQSEAKTAPTNSQLLSELCDSFLPALITCCKLPVYTTTTECDRRYGYTTARRLSYAESLCLQVNSDLMALINSLGSRDDSQLFDSLSREQEQLCDVLSRFYDVLRPEEEKVKAYVQQRDEQCPLVVTGGPCTGKTVLLAHCAQQIQSWLPGCDPAVITHFCEISLNTSSKHLLSSLCYQIAHKCHNQSFPKQDPSSYVCSFPVCSSKPRDQSSCRPTSVLDSHPHPVSSQNPNTDPKGFRLPGVTLSELREHLSSLLTLLPSPKQPLLLILDGLDQIEHSVSLPVIDSLPSPLPPGVKLIFTVSSRQTHILQAIDVHYPQCTPPHRVPLGTPDRKARLKMLAALLSSSGRKVTSGQQALLNKALTSCCLTLYARLLHVHTSVWQSDLDEAELSLPDGVHSSISALLDLCERKHGSSVVTRALSYLALSRTGLTEAELADLLSSDEHVPVEYARLSERSFSSLRVPQIDLETLLLDLRKFLIRRTVLGSDVLFWVSRHFKLVVAKKYLKNPHVRREIHSEMADYFSGRRACGNATALSVNPKSDVCTDRRPSSQPFVFTSSSTDVGRVNLRKVVELPYHLQLSDRWEELERGLLMSLSFHGAMVRAGLLCDLVALLEQDEGSSRCQLSREKRLLASTLTSSACLLLRSPLQLPAVMETSLLPYLQVFPVLEEYVKEIRQERKRRETGLGAVLCPAPSSVPFIKRLRLDAAAKGASVAGAAGTECGVVAVVMDDGSVWVWRSTERDVVELSPSRELSELAFAGVKSSGQLMLLSTRCNKLFLGDMSGPNVLLEVKTELESDQQTPDKTGGFVACRKKAFVWWENASVVIMFCVSSEMATRFQCQSSVTCLVCSSDGCYLYCGQEEGAVSIFDVETSSLLGTCSSSRHSEVTSIVLCDDQGRMACVDVMGNITLWGLAAETQPPAVIKEMLIGGESTTVCNVDYSRENDLLLVCQSHRVSLWETCEWDTMDKFLAPRDTTFTQAVLSQDCHLFVASMDACALVLVWRVHTGECVLSLETNTQPHSLLRTASHVLCVGRDGCLTAWDSGMIEAAGAAPKMGSGVREVLLEPAGVWFYTADGSEAVWRWNLDTGLPHENLLHAGPVEKLRLSLNGVHLVSLSAEEIYVWLTETGQNTLRISASRTTDILITPNCNFGVSLSERELSRVWKLTHGSVVCSIPLHLSDAQVSPESTFLVGRHRGDLLAASLWFGSISKRFSCVESSEHVVAFHTLSAHPDFVVALGASGAVYTWNMVEETTCRHFLLPYTLHCRPQDFQVSTDGSYALLSTDSQAIGILDLHQVRLCSLNAEGPVIKACLDKSGGYVFYVTRLDKSGACFLHSRPVLTVVRLADGERVGSVHLRETPSALVAWEPRCVFVGFEDGSVAAFSVSDAMTDREESTGGREGFTREPQQCPFDRAPLIRLPLATPSVTWP